MLPDYYGIKLDANSRKITGITGIHRSLNQTFLNNTGQRKNFKRN